MSGGDDAIGEILNRAGRQQLERMREQQRKGDDGRANPFADSRWVRGRLYRAMENALLEQYDELIAASTDPDVPRALFHDVARLLGDFVLDGKAMDAAANPDAYELTHRFGSPQK